MPHRAGAIALFIACLPAVAAGQPAETRPTVTIAYEASRDRFQYRFENPSSFDTADLVPHDFTQTYWGDNQWAVVTARYRLGRRVMTSEAAVTPSRATRGDDIDSFFQPSGDIVISGTSGSVDLRSVRLRHTIALGTAAGLAWHVGYHYRRDHSAFHARQIKTVIHSQPPSRESFSIDGSETTISQIHEVRVGVGREWAPAAAWRIGVAVDAAPTTRARLTTILPLKYPGREIVFSATVMTLNPVLTVSRGTRWPVVLSLASTQTFSYVAARQFTRRAVSASVGIGRRFE